MTIKPPARVAGSWRELWGWELKRAPPVLPRVHPPCQDGKSRGCAPLQSWDMGETRRSIKASLLPPEVSLGSQSELQLKKSLQFTNCQDFREGNGSESRGVEQAGGEGTTKEARFHLLCYFLPAPLSDGTAVGGKMSFSLWQWGGLLICGRDSKSSLVRLN